MCRPFPSDRAPAIIGSMMDAKTRLALRELLATAHVASLATLHDGAPAVSLAPWAPAEDGHSLFVHVSGLASHTGDMLADPRVSMMIAEPESSGTLPQALPRVMVRGLAREVDRETTEYQSAKRAYLARHPRSEMTFGLGDFSLFAIEPDATRYVAGFGRAYDVENADFAKALREKK
jgi:putative heme iron utilization protein